MEVNYPIGHVFKIEKRWGFTDEIVTEYRIVVDREVTRNEAGEIVKTKYITRPKP